MRRWCEHCRGHYPTNHYEPTVVDEQTEEPSGGYHRAGREYGPYGELLATEEGVQRVIKLCESKLIETEGGGLTDADTLWPSEVLDALGPEVWTGPASWRD